jgi:hypothetical protein
MNKVISIKVAKWTIIFYQLTKHIWTQNKNHILERLLDCIKEFEYNKKSQLICF